MTYFEGGNYLVTHIYLRLHRSVVWDALRVHDLCLEVIDGVGGLSLDGDGLTA